MAALLAVGVIAATSTDFTLTTDTASLFLVSATGPVDPEAVATLEVKSALGNYYPIGSLTARQSPFLVLSSPGTYRVSRVAGATFGVDKS